MNEQHWSGWDVEVRQLPEKQPQETSLSLSFRKIILSLAIVSLISGGMGAGMVYLALSTQAIATVTESTSPYTLPVSETVLLMQQGYLDYEKNTIDVVNASLPGVVLVSTTGTSYESWGFFGPFGGSRNTPRTVVGNGSGFIYDLSGHIVTNYHVIEDADSIKVTLYSGKSYDATVVGSDPLSDLAVLKINAPAAELKPLPVADSNLVQVGQKAIAIGSPLASSQSESMGLNRSPTVTQGIVSATDRTMSVDDGTQGGYSIEGLIQTDASINPGNSGGPLLNSAGEVIGVNTAIISGAQGLGFAIPSSLVQKNAADIIAGRPIGRPYMGITYRSLDDWKKNLDDDYKKLNLTVEQGAWITSVEPGSPAANAGIQGSNQRVQIEGIGELDIGGDIITHIDGAVVTGSNLLNLMRFYSPGDVISLTVLRGGRVLDVSMELGIRPVN
ncbi:MAG: trypsin-like peptidase domain-containing protein [Symbiobacteriaceae bacterium]|nr:trypsin-like peptidase domain-containing protein [Symbiobacteriaceae bacterium]